MTWADAKAFQGRGIEGLNVDVNGEVVREDMERWRVGQYARAGVWGVGWCMGLVGLWGDGA
jgi:hypothetical protein